MNSAQTILLTGVLTASACALLGSFLILRRSAMMADAISHAILPGLVLGYFLADGPNLFAGFLGATLAATITVGLVAALQRTGRVDANSAIGLVFPAMFALGTVLISKYFSNVHLDTDAVLYGNIEFSSFDRFMVGERDLGPQSLWVMGVLLIVNCLFIGLFYKELKITTFDAALAASIGISPVLMHYALMGVLSITTVGAFTVVGAILVIALIIVPAATAYLLTERLVLMVIGSVAIGIVSAIGGYELAIKLDASISGSIVTVTGFFFFLALLLSPSQGLLTRLWQRNQQRKQFAIEVMVAHMLGHTSRGESAASLANDLAWSPSKVADIVKRADRHGLLEQRENGLFLTEDGISAAHSTLAR